MKIFFISLLIGLVIRVGISAIFSNSKKESDSRLIKELTERKFVLKFPKFVRWIGYIGIIEFLSFVTIFRNETSTLYTDLLFILFIIVSVLLVYAEAVWKIEIFENEAFFTYKTSIKKPVTIHFDEVKSCTETRNGWVIDTENKKVYISKAISDSWLFNSIYERYKRLHNNNNKKNR